MMSKFKQKQIRLREKSFTDELKNNSLLLDVEFNNLEVKVDHLMIYRGGGILRVYVDLTEHNRSILSKFIKDFDAYNELIETEFVINKKENRTDLISIIDYVNEVHRETLFYDRENESFYYENGDEY